MKEKIKYFKIKTSTRGFVFKLFIFFQHMDLFISKCIYIYIYIYIFIIQRVKAHGIPCPHQPPTRGDNTVSVAQSSSATPGATKQLLPPDSVLREFYIYIYIYIYIYMPDQLRAETTLDDNLHF